ncbi:hypothetical protein HPB50_027971 [Hyalomma asiaticum]|nr:hypothetical protein HPB50_027971 [Hyalomma asiaticum]
MGKVSEKPAESDHASNNPVPNPDALLQLKLAFEAEISFKDTVEAVEAKLCKIQKILDWGNLMGLEEFLRPKKADAEAFNTVHFSRTLGCVPTCDRELMDALDILKYANRANSIRNRITVNQDNWNHTSPAHRVEIQRLELMECKQGKRMAEDGTEQVNDMFYETSLLQTGNYIRKRNEALEEMIEQLTAKYMGLLAEQASGAWVGRGDSDTALDVDHLIQGYLNQEDESKNGTDADEDTADNIGNESSAYEAEEMEEYVNISRILACVSTCDRELMDTLDILKYANRANRIRNRIIVNQDKWNRTSAAHRVEIQKLKLELMEYKQERSPRRDDRAAHRKYTGLLAEQASGAWVGRGDSNTADDVDHLIQEYLNQEDESEKGTDADEDTADNIGNESSAYEAEEMEEYVHFSHTLPIACVSTCDLELMETLDILKYSDRANSIRKRIMVNQDKWNQTSAVDRVEIQKLKLELLECKQGKRMAKDGTEQVNDMFYETSLLQTGNYLRKRNEALGEMIEQLTAKYMGLLAEQASGAWVGRDDSGTVDDVGHLTHGYLNEEEEIEKSTDADEDTADNSGNESSDYEAQQLEEYVAM